MVVVVAENYIIPEKAEEFKAAMKPVVERVRTEPGCVAYDLAQHKKDPSIFVFVEKWADKDALRAHGNAEWFLAALAEVKPLQSAPTKMSIYSSLF